MLHCNPASSVRNSNKPSYWMASCSTISISYCSISILILQNFTDWKLWWKQHFSRNPSKCKFNKNFPKINPGRGFRVFNPMFKSTRCMLARSIGSRMFQTDYWMVARSVGHHFIYGCAYTIFLELFQIQNSTDFYFWYNR